MKFPEKLWTIINECKSGAIGWSADGKTVFVDYGKFENEFLGVNSAVFKTKNVVSFIRQLNLYGFRKCSRFNDVHEFRNPYFIRDREDLLKYMKRKLGCCSDIFPRTYGEKRDFTSKEDEKDDVLHGSRQLFNNTPTVPKQVHPPPYFNFQDVNSLPYGWWGNSYLPMNSMYALNSARSTQGEHSSVKVEKENGDTAEDRNVQPHWGSLDMYKNVIFVPVPAEYGMFPGLFNNNFSFPFSTPTQEGKEIYDAKKE